MPQVPIPGNAQRVLVVTDCPEDAAQLQQMLGQASFTAQVCQTVVEAEGVLSAEAAQLLLAFILCDEASTIDGFDLLRRYREHVRMVMVFNACEFTLINTAKQQGAFDFLFKPFTRDRIERLRTRLTVNPEEERIMRWLNQRMIGRSPAWLAALQQTARAILNLKKEDFGVLILGESGTGKGLIARAIHEAGVYADRPFFHINASTLTPDLLESKLFGHKKGSFTGAERDQKGILQLAGNGIVFLDEVGTLPISSQAKVLRVLQEKSFERLGDPGNTLRFMGRLICASNESLPAAIKAGRFQADLFYRINKYVIRTPRLAERGDDSLRLLDYFLKGHPHDPAVRDIVLKYPFPGNVRQLEEMVRAAIATAGSNIINPIDLDLETMNELIR